MLCWSICIISFLYTHTSCITVANIHHSLIKMLALNVGNFYLFIYFKYEFFYSTKVLEGFSNLGIDFTFHVIFSYCTDQKKNQKSSTFQNDLTCSHGWKLLSCKRIFVSKTNHCPPKELLTAVLQKILCPTKNCCLTNELLSYKNEVLSCQQTK